MQPLAVKLPRVHRTPFSVEDILDPTKFTKRISPSGRTGQTRREPIERGVFDVMDQNGQLSINCVFRRFLRRRIGGAPSSSRWKLQAAEEGSMPREAGFHQGQEASDPHRLYSGAAADAGAQLPEVPLPVSAGAAQHRFGPAPL